MFIVKLLDVIVQIGETSNTELDSIIQQVKHIKYKGNAQVFCVESYTGWSESKPSSLCYANTDRF